MRSPYSEQILDEFGITTMEQLLNVNKNQLKSFVKAHVAPDSIQSSNIMKSFNQTYTNNEFLTPQEDFLDEFIDKQGGLRVFIANVQGGTKLWSPRPNREVMRLSEPYQ